MSCQLRLGTFCLAAAARKEHANLRAIVDALGGTRMLALECDVSTWTVRAWLAGSRQPSPLNKRRIDTIARDFGLPALYGQWHTGVRRRPLLDS